MSLAQELLWLCTLEGGTAPAEVGRLPSGKVGDGAPPSSMQTFHTDGFPVLETFLSCAGGQGLLAFTKI